MEERMTHVMLHKKRWLQGIQLKNVSKSTVEYKWHRCQTIGYMARNCAEIMTANDKENKAE